MTALFDRVCQVFLDKPELPGVKKSRDSNDKKLIITVPSNLVQKLGDLIAQVEENIPEVMIDLELNSLEDAFIKIAESDILAEEQKMQALANKELFLSPEDEEKAMEDYFSFEGRQNCCMKIIYVLVHRLHLFKRDGLQWFAVIVPIMFVAMMSFQFYSIMRTVLDEIGEDLDKILAQIIKFIFVIFLTMGSTFTAGMTANAPMEEKKQGLRHMMRL